MGRPPRRGDFCPRCFARLRTLAVTTTGGNVDTFVVDPQPNPAGTIAAKPDPTARGGWGYAYRVTRAKPLAAGWHLFMPHTDSCSRPPAPPKLETPSLLAPELCGLDACQMVGLCQARDGCSYAMPQHPHPDPERTSQMIAAMRETLHRRRTEREDQP